MLEKQTAIQGADVLTSTGWLKDATVVVEAGKFITIEPVTTPKGATLVDARGLQMLPGIVDIHGDAFERMISPRPGISFPLPLALAENDRNLIAAGITTFFYSITDSYEPGLRSRDTARQILEFVLKKGRQSLRCDSRIHIRHEQANMENHEELCTWLETRQVDLLSLNDHVPPRGDEGQLARHLKGLQRRLTMSDFEMKAFVEQMHFRREQGSQQQLPQAKPLPGAVRLTEHLHQHQIPQAVATSSARRPFCLKTTHYQEWFALFDVIVVGDDPVLQRGKPAPDIFLLAAQRLGAIPEQCLVFEDAHAGMEAALAAGMSVIVVPPPSVDKQLYREANQILDSLTDFEPHLWQLPSFADLKHCL